MLLGFAGGVGFYWGLVGLINAEEPSVENSGMAGLPEGILMISSAALYIPMLIWDGIGGVKGVKEYNRIEKQRHREETLKKISLRPNMNISPNGDFHAGLELKF